MKRRFTCYLLLLLCLLAAPLVVSAQEDMDEDAYAASDEWEYSADEEYLEDEGDALDNRVILMLPGTVVAGDTVAVLAPYGGIVTNISSRAGDIVSASDTLLTIGTTKVYAPCDGVVGDVGLAVGSEAAAFQERYGALLYIEPSSQFIVQTDENATGVEKTQVVHIGEMLYIGSRISNDRYGTGFVTSIEGKTFKLEVTDGNLILDDSVSMYRSRNFNEKTRVGVGKTQLNTNVAVSAEGSVFKIHVKQGDSVKKGDLLLETVAGSIGYNPYPSESVVSGYDAIVSSVDTSHGAKVEKDAVLAKLTPMDSLQIAVTASETELNDIRIGSEARIEFLGLYGEEPLKGTVSDISALNEEEGARYLVYVDFETEQVIRLGMTATVYFNE